MHGSTAVPKLVTTVSGYFGSTVAAILCLASVSFFGERSKSPKSVVSS